jgi:hypothetical protein
MFPEQFVSEVLNPAFPGHFQPAEPQKGWRAERSRECFSKSAISSVRRFDMVCSLGSMLCNEGTIHPRNVG